MDKIIAMAYVYVCLRCVFLKRLGSYRLFGSPRNPNKSRETRLIKECFHDTFDYVCFSSYYKNESEKNGNGREYIFLGNTALNLRRRAPTLIYS